jgi:hypothetical protein
MKNIHGNFGPVIYFHVPYYTYITHLYKKNKELFQKSFLILLKQLFILIVIFFLVPLHHKFVTLSCDI